VSGVPELAYGWSFLVARGRRRGYCTILAPDFLARRGLQEVLSESAGGSPEGGVHQLELDQPGVGPITLVYESEQPAAGELDGGAPALDEHGRPLEILYGIVSRDRLDGRVDAGDLRNARSEALNSYRRFLAEEDGFEIDTSKRFGLHGVVARRAPVRTEPRPPKAARERRSAPAGRAPFGLAALAALALLALVLAYRAVSPGDDGRITAVTARAQGSADCTGRLSLAGTITTDGDAEVTYHWVTPAGPQPPQHARLQGAESRPIALDTDPVVGTYRLVVDAPGSMSGAASYSCASADAQVGAHAGALVPGQ
jgi:hypothetical protein